MRTLLLAVAVLLLVPGCEEAAPPAGGLGPAVPAAGPPPLPTPGTPALPSASPAASQPAGSAEAAFIAAYRRAMESKDVEAMLRLYCLDGVPAEMQDVMRGNIRDELKQSLDTIEISPGTDVPESTVEGGVRFRANLKPVATVRLTYKPSGIPGNFDITSSVGALGLKRGAYLMPVSNRE